MDPLHRRAKDIFLAALERSRDERVAFLDEACGDDAGLRQEVESLLAFHDEETGGAAEPAAPPRDRFVPGDVVAGRYRMITRIGRGGMGDVWRADDLVLQTPVALKVIDSNESGGRERILNEVRLARKITHPAVCRVFDVGKAEGDIVFFTMELVNGEDLASLLRRVGRLPSDRVIELAHQLCAGLAAAHAQGILHRDLKPANVLIDDDGQVRITDFGIAIPRDYTGRHLRTGTPGYMAPEQRIDGTQLTERTDVYALGLVLYELLVGRYAFEQRSQLGEPPLPSTIIPNVNAQLERAVMKALSPSPKDRHASAEELAASLPGARPRPITTPGAVPVAPRRRLTSRHWIAAAALGVVVILVAAASTYFLSARGRELNEQDTIVLADFENQTGDQVFDGALKVALAVALEQSPFLKVFPDDRARDTLRLMRRAPDEPINRILAREIARREQLKALIAGSITMLGRNYVITLETINTESGDVMAREQAEAASKEQVLTALGGATSRLREKLGESLASVQKFDAPLPRATTQSLDALHAYSLALINGAQVPRLEAIPHLERAIALDPAFAMAHAFLSGVYANTGQTSLAPTYSRRAFDLRDRVSERERFFISWRYYRDALQDWEKGLELSRSWTETYPREAFAFNALGTAYLRLGSIEQSLAPFREAIRIDPRFVPAYSNLAGALMSLNRYDDARATLKQAADLRLTFAGANRLSYLLAFIQGDAATMAREIEASVGPGETNAAFGWQGHVSAFNGRIGEAHERFDRGVQVSRQANFSEVAAQLTVEDAEMHAIVGQCHDAAMGVSAALELSRDNSTLERAGRALAMCGTQAEVSALSGELARRFSSATLTTRIALPVIAALMAMRQGDATRAIALLEPVHLYDHASSTDFWPEYLRGKSYLQLKDRARATPEFQRILDHRGEAPVSMLYPLAYLELARAAMLDRDTAAARAAYERFFSIWHDADADLQPLKDARAEYAALGTPRDGGGPRTTY